MLGLVHVNPKIPSYFYSWLYHVVLIYPQCKGTTVSSGLILQAEACCIQIQMQNNENAAVITERSTYKTLKSDMPWLAFAYVQGSELPRCILLLT